MTTSIKSSADGTQAIIQVNGVDRAIVDSSGNLNVTGKVSQAAQSMVRLNTANGYGSTNTKIRRFTNVVVNQGSDITYADSATLGASFTINTSGVYSICYDDQFSAASNYGISLNTSAPSTDIYSIPITEILSIAASTGSGALVAISWSGYLASGSIIRVHTAGISTGTYTPACQFTITRVA